MAYLNDVHETTASTFLTNIRSQLNEASLRAEEVVQSVTRTDDLTLKKGNAKPLDYLMKDDQLITSHLL